MRVNDTDAFDRVVIIPEEVLSDPGMTPAEKLVASYLVRVPRATASRVAGGIGVNKVTVYRALAALQERGVVVCLEAPKGKGTGGLYEVRDSTGVKIRVPELASGPDPRRHLYGRRTSRRAG